MQARTPPRLIGIEITSFDSVKLRRNSGSEAPWNAQKNPDPNAPALKIAIFAVVILGCSLIGILLFRYLSQTTPNFLSIKLICD